VRLAEQELSAFDTSLSAFDGMVGGDDDLLDDGDLDDMY
jgi:hypothetical protein